MSSCAELLEGGRFVRLLPDHEESDTKMLVGSRVTRIATVPAPAYFGETLLGSIPFNSQHCLTRWHEDVRSEKD